MEYITARDSGAVVVAARARAPSTPSTRQRIIVRVEGEDERDKRKEMGADIYTDDEVQALEPEHVHQPEADRPRRPEGRTRARSWPTGRAPSWASWRSAATCSSRSCRGAATTSRTRSSSPRSW